MELLGVLCILFIITFVICFLLYESIEMSSRLETIEYFLHNTHVVNNNADIEKEIIQENHIHPQVNYINDRNMNNTQSSYRRPTTTNLQNNDYENLRKINAKH